MEAIECIKGRRSIREFKPDTVSPQVIEEIVELVVLGLLRGSLCRVLPAAEEEESGDQCGIKACCRISPGTLDILLSELSAYDASASVSEHEADRL